MHEDIVKGYRLKIRRNSIDLLYAMRLVCEWENMRAYCLDRRTCRGCPYWTSMTCTRKNTEQILQHASQIFEDYIEKEPVL